MNTKVEPLEVQPAGHQSRLPLEVRNLLALNGLKAVWGHIAYQPAQMGWRIMRDGDDLFPGDSNWMPVRDNFLCHARDAQMAVYAWERTYELRR